MKTQTMTFALIACAAFVAAPLSGAGAVTPPKIIQTTEVHFPVALEFTAISSGEVDVMMKIDATGKLEDVLLTGYSRKEFGDEALLAIREWTFEPALKDGKPIESRMKLNIKFTSDARVVTLMPVETPAMLLRRAHVPDNVDLVCRADELDKPLAVLETATPVHPGREAGPKKGMTVVDFFVDESGHARLPIVMQSTDPAFSEATIRAIKDWRFAPPTRDGRPAIVRMQQEFVFTKDT